MAEKIAVENGRISNYKGLVILNLTLDLVILHTVVYHSSTSTYMPNIIEIKETFLSTDGRTYVRICTYVRRYVCTHVHTNGRTFETSIIRSPLLKSNSRPKNRVAQKKRSRQ